MNRSELEQRGLRTTLTSAVMLALTVACLSGCGDETDDTGTPDAGTQTNTDAGTGTDAGTDAGTTTPAVVDTDLALARFNTNGTLDTTFGTAGVARVNLGTGNSSVRDSLWGMDRDGSDRLILFAGKKGDGERSDNDRLVVRLTANGALDTTFAEKGIHTLNMGGLSDNSRHGFVQADGKIVTSGYIAQPTGVGAQVSNNILLARLNADGKPDTTFGSKGVVNSNPFRPADALNTEWGFAEAYGVAAHTGGYVTAGYGRAATSGPMDVLACRYTAAGQLDTTWGTNGFFLMDLVGEHDRSRDLVVLPDNRVFMVGSGTPTKDSVDAMAVMLKADGTRDTGFTADGYKLYDFGRADEAFFDTAVSPAGDRVAAAGYRAGGGQNDDATLLLLPIGSGTVPEFAQAVPLSTTGNDRFWAVTFDASGKVYAAGYLTEGGDNRMAVARFNADGTRDASFGQDGIVTVNVAVAGTLETARSVVVQSDGKVVVAGVAETP